MWSAGEQVIDRHTDSRDVFFVAKGSVRVAIYSISGQVVTFDDLGAGGHFGDIAAIDGAPRSANVVVLTDTLLASLSPDNFLKILRDHPPLALELMRNLTSIVRISTDRIMDLSTLGAQNRVHAEILRLANRASSEEERVAGKRTRISPSPPHADLASRVSTTRETVSRVINDLARRKIIGRSRDALVILDIGRLEKMVEDVRGD
jgi:CRP-like cAMP-binding protein